MNSKCKDVAEQENSPSSPINELKQRASPSTGPWSKTFLEKADQLKYDTIVEDPLKRRSERMQHLRKGFKDPQCSSKNYLGCNVEPPTLSPYITKNLGNTFCKIDESKLTETALLKKKKVTVSVPGGKKT